MKEIQLPEGKVALVDDVEFERLNVFKWFLCKAGKGYVCRTKRTGDEVKRIYMSWELITPPNGFTVKFKDGNPLNCQRENLWLAAGNYNFVKKTSKYRGVSWSRSNKKWRSVIGWVGKKVFLGFFDDEVAAAKAYDTASLTYRGPLSCLNFPRRGVRV